MLVILVLVSFAGVFGSDINALQSQVQQVSKGSNLTLVFSITNPTTSTIALPMHLTPFEGVFADIFEFSGPEAVEYTGMLAKRVSDEESGLLRIAPGQTLSTTVGVSLDYAFYASGSYKVSWRFGVYQPAEMDIEAYGDLRFGANSTSKMTAPNNFQNCNANERTQVLAADVTATSDCRSSVTCLTADTCPVSFVTWFGARTEARYTRTRTNFVALQRDFNSGNYRIFCNPAGCSPNVYAYVFPTDRTHVVYLCSVFWRLPNERAETLVHELSHFNDVASTRDFAYGQGPCKTLARNNPANAIANADNVCYFARGYTF